KERERDLARRIEAYGARRRSAEAMLETGVGDSEAAMRQLDQVRAIVDELETDTLVVMEEQGALGAALAAGEAATSAARAVEEEARRAAPDAIGRLEASIAELETARTAMAAQLHPELRTRYQRLLEPKGSGVGWVRDTA